MAKTPRTPARVRMVNSDGIEAHPLPEDVPTWEAAGWRVEPMPSPGLASAEQGEHQPK